MIKEKLEIIFTRKDNGIDVCQTNLIEFLNSEGFGICRDENHFLNGRLLQNKDNIVNLFNPKELGFYIIDLMKSNQIDADFVEKFIRGNTSYLSSANIQLLQTLNVDILKDEKNIAYLPFQNGLCIVTPDVVKIIPYAGLKKTIYKQSIISHNFTYDHNREDGDFPTFCKMLTGQNQDRYNSLKSIMGYLILNNKERKENKVVLVYDSQMGNNKEANGGTGKSLLIAGAISQVRNVLPIDGKRIDIRNTRFIYQNVEHHTNNIVLDDVKTDFSLEMIFSAVTDGFEVEKKNLQSRRIEYEDAPKFAITANHLIKMPKGSSSNRRKIELILDNAFNENYSPIDCFGNAFFSRNWGEKQYNAFYTFIIDCLQFYMANGLYEAKMTDELLENRIIGLIGKETYQYFKEYVPSWVNQHRLIKKDSLDHHNKSTNLEISSIAFTKKLEIYCDCKKLVYQSQNSGSILYFTISTITNE